MLVVRKAQYPQPRSRRTATRWENLVQGKGLERSKARGEGYLFRRSQLRLPEPSLGPARLNRAMPIGGFLVSVRLENRGQRCR